VIYLGILIDNFTCIEDHGEEIFVILVANAIVDPLAMMVHLEPANLALTAMMRS
jgi:hypothetical protein